MANFLSRAHMNSAKLMAPHISLHHGCPCYPVLLLLMQLNIEVLLVHYGTLS